MLITGASGGLGNELVKSYIANGDEVFACFRVLDGREERLKEGLSIEENQRLHIQKLDLENNDEIDSTIKTLIEANQSIDILINNGGTTASSSFLLTKYSELERVFRINLFGPARLSQIVGRQMAKQNGGSIIFISSILAFEAHEGTSIYSMTKAAGNQLVKVMAQELSRFRIRVNAVAPGLINTKMLEKNGLLLREKLVELSAQRRIAEVDEIAKVVLFLTSDEASHINGQVLRVDGGRP